MMETCDYNLPKAVLIDLSANWWEHYNPRTDKTKIADIVSSLFGTNGFIVDNFGDIRFVEQYNNHVTVKVSDIEWTTF